MITAIARPCHRVQPEARKGAPRQAGSETLRGNADPSAYWLRFTLTSQKMRRGTCMITILMIVIRMSIDEDGKNPPDDRLTLPAIGLGAHAVHKSFSAQWRGASGISEHKAAAYRGCI